MAKREMSCFELLSCGLLALLDRRDVAISAGERRTIRRMLRILGFLGRACRLFSRPVANSSERRIRHA